MASVSQYEKLITEANQARNQDNYLKAAQSALAAVDVASSAEQRFIAHGMAFWFFQIANAPGLLAKAGVLEAAQHYSDFWPDEAKRCRVTAQKYRVTVQKYRSDAETAAVASVGYTSARARLDMALHKVPTGDVSSRAGFQPEHHERDALKGTIQNMFPDIILEGPRLQDNHYFGKGHTLQDSVYIAARSHRIWNERPSSDAWAAAKRH